MVRANRVSMRSRRSTPWVVADSRRTKGPAMRASHHDLGGGDPGSPVAQPPASQPLGQIRTESGLADDAIEDTN